MPLNEEQPRDLGPITEARLKELFGRALVISLDQAAELFSVSTKTLRDMIKTERVEAHKHGARWFLTERGVRQVLLRGVQGKPLFEPRSKVRVAKSKPEPEPERPWSHLGKPSWERALAGGGQKGKP